MERKKDDPPTLTCLGISLLFFQTTIYHFTPQFGHKLHKKEANVEIILPALLM